TDRVHHLLLIKRRPPTSPLFPYTTLFRSEATTASTSSQRDKTFPTPSRPAHGAGARRLCGAACLLSAPRLAAPGGALGGCGREVDRKSTRLNSSHVKISYAVFCLKKKKHQ